MGNEVALFNGEQTNALPTGVNRIEGKRENLSDFREAFKAEPQPGTRKGERMSGNAPQAIPAPSCNGTLRCAIYTRKSTDEGLDQDFNSLDAQREAAQAYVASQRQEGWVCLAGRCWTSPASWSGSTGTG